MKKLVCIVLCKFLLLFAAEANSQCCQTVQLSLSGSASDWQAERVGRYQLSSLSEYRQIGGKNMMYKFEDEAWHFGVDLYTSGIQSNMTEECPDMEEWWRFWRGDGDLEKWSDFQNNEITVTCVTDPENQAGAEHLENMIWMDETSSSMSTLYTEQDGPNVDCSMLDKNDASYPPSPRVVLLGGSGVGKSTLGNQLLGCYKKDGECEYFSVGHGSSSHTIETFWAVGNYMGKGGCITLVDTPGASDSEGRDFDHALEMVTVLKHDLTSIDVFLLTFKGTDSRFLASITKLLKLYESIFSEDLWHHAITEMTYWKWDETSVEDRFYDQEMNAIIKHNQWNKEYQDKLGVKIGQVPTVFIDPVFPIFSKTPRNKRKVKKQPEALEKFIFHSNLLWNLATAMPPFYCKEKCSAPSGYFLGAPWVTQPIVKGRLGSVQVLSCQIWKGIVGTASTDNVKWKWTIEMNEIIIYEKNTDVSDTQNSFTVTHQDWVDKILVKENENEHFSEFQLTLQNLTSETHGKYTCENNRSSVNNQATMLLIVDGAWADWGPWGSCSKSCMEEEGKPGVKIRNRDCILPQNGGKECIESEAKDQEICAGDDPSFTFCPINHLITEWSEWADCSRACGSGTAWRTRNCEEGRFGGTQCPETANLEETQVCTIKPCPACKEHEWGGWSSCSISCLDTQHSNTYGTKIRNREFEEIDEHTPVCDPDDHQESSRCAGDEDNFVSCPVDAKWTRWSEYGRCSVTCGEGKYTRVRTCTEQWYGGTPCDQLAGDNKEVVTCIPTYGPCPQDCELSDWTSWGTCNRNCGPGLKKRTKHVIKHSKYGGKNDCKQLEDSGLCNLKVCPPCDKYFKSWTAWTSCSSKGGYQTRKQSFDITKQQSEFTGMDCRHVEDKVQTNECPVDCAWRGWSQWTSGTCSNKECSKGKQKETRTRSIQTQKQGKGKHCTGHDSESQFVTCECCNSCFKLKNYGHNFMWNDKRSGGKYDFSCWEPRMYGMFGSIPSNYHYFKPGDRRYVDSYPPGWFRNPTGYGKIWGDHGSGAARDGSFWYPKCPAGYSSLGDYCQTGYSEPSTSQMLCARTDLTKSCSASWVWNDKSTGSYKDASVFVTADGYMWAYGYHTSSSSARCLDI